MTLPKRDGWRRVECGCGCGVWFYDRREFRRPRLYVNAEHCLRAKYQRRRARQVVAASLLVGGEG